MNVLEVKQLKKSYRTGFFKSRQEVLHGVDFYIPKGTVTGFLGRNGAGKTTTIKCILELAFKDSGEYVYFGSKGLTEESKRRIGFLPERPYFYDYLTAQEFLTFYASLGYGLDKKTIQMRIDELLELVELNHAKNQKLRGFSKGMLQRIGIAQTLIHDPDFIILDEPLSGLDPDGRYKLASIVRRTAENGKTVFLSSHLLHDTEQFCERLVILKKGTVFFEGAQSDFLSKFDAGFNIDWQEGKFLKHEHIGSLEELQKRLDELRKDGKIILKVEPKRASLEEAFVKITKDD